MNSEQLTLTFKQDTSLRRRYFTPESFVHPAKMNSYMLRWIVGKYTEPNEVILDPMAGTGTTMLAATFGRNVILVELEEKFCRMCQDNWAKFVATGNALGTCQIIQGDARNLEGLLVDKIITSPPYAIPKTTKGSLNAQEGRVYQDKRPGRNGTEYEFSGQEELGHPSPNNIANLKYGNIDSIITSPPYEGSISGETTKKMIARKKEILESKGWTTKTSGLLRGIRADQSIKGFLAGYSAEDNNIGNLKSDTYLQAMLQVYQQCYKVLKPEGLMILVTKNFIRNKQIVHLDFDTIELCQQAGFELIDWHFRKLTQQSFWRIIYYKKHPEVERLLYEDILVFKKENNGSKKKTNRR